MRKWGDDGAVVCHLRGFAAAQKRSRPPAYLLRRSLPPYRVCASAQRPPAQVLAGDLREDHGAAAVIDEGELRAIAFEHLPPELRSEDDSIFLEVDSHGLAAVRLLPCDRDHRLVERYRNGELVSTRIMPV